MYFVDVCCCVFFFKQKTAYEMRISDRSSTCALPIFFAPQPIANAQVMGPQTAEGCIRVSDPRPKLSVSGRLTLQLFPGAPNFESIAAGDVEEQTFIVELPHAACIDDGGHFADPAENFVTVQVSGPQDRLSAVLKAAGGQIGE